MAKNKCHHILLRGVNKGKPCDKLKCKTHLSTLQAIKQVPLYLDLPTPIKTQIMNLCTSNNNKDIIMKHYNNIKKLDSSSSEYYKNQLFIDQALAIPWNKYYNILDQVSFTEQGIPHFINKLQSEFDKHIHGMDNIKNEIINHICKFISNPSCKNNVLALYGSAGVCKTKFIKVLSDVLNIPLKIISLGGKKDSSFLLGNGYVYVESHCGVIIQNIIDTNIMNPIMYFDELDKVSETNGGQDIFSVLSNVTDPTINDNFSDNYFRGLTVDLSKVFYIFTFNDISKINKVLLDRLNVIYVDNPTNKEKMVILEQYCLQDIIDNIGIKYTITFDQECFKSIIDYTNKNIDLKISSGIRESIRILEKILLEINKEQLIHPQQIIGNLHISFDIFNYYFNKLKSQFLYNQNENENHNHHMYI